MSNKNLFICSNCGNVSKPEIAIKGSTLIELILWLCFIIPGIIYSVWRSSSRYQVCSKCDSTNLIPIDSPMAKKIISDLGIENEVKISMIGNGNFFNKERKTSTLFIVVLVIFTFVMISIISVMIG